MLSRVLRYAAPCAVIALASCAGGDALRREVDALHGEIVSLRQQQDAMARRLDLLAARLEAPPPPVARAAGASPAGAPGPAAAAPAPAADAPAPLVPKDLAVVRISPPRAGRPAPPIAIAVPVSEPEPDRLEALAQPTGRELAVEAEGELAAARRRAGVDRAHALEAFVARYPRHPSADNALVEAAKDYAEAGREGAGCELAARVPRDYPAGDAVAGANEIVARCERSRP